MPAARQPRRPRWARAGVARWLATALVFASAGAAGASDRFDRPADWVVSDGVRIVGGSGNELWRLNRHDRNELVRTATLPGSVRGAALAGPLLFFVENGNRLGVLDLEGAHWPAGTTRHVALDPEPRGRLRLAVLSRFLAVAEDGFGIRLLELPVHAHEDRATRGGSASALALRPAARLTLETRFGAVAGLPRTLLAADESGRILEIDVDDSARLGVSRVTDGPRGILAMAATGRRIFALTEAGLRVLPRDGAAGPEVLHPEVSGSSLALAGRDVFVAAGPAGVASFRDRAAGAELYPVTVGSNFFSPVSLTIEVGDVVRWTNSTPVAHNVVSCIPSQPGCMNQTSSESFTSGPAAPGLWVASHVFAVPGTNSYVCQPHFNQMWGEVTVEAAVSAPPAVPDGAAGAPMLVTKVEPTGSILSIAWDDATCPGAVDHQILFSLGSFLNPGAGGIYRLTGSRCNVGSSPYTWFGAGDPSNDASRYLWWLVVAEDGDGHEGSWGTDSGGTERTGVDPGGSSGECGITAKDLTDTCGQ